MLGLGVKKIILRPKLDPSTPTPSPPTMATLSFDDGFENIPTIPMSFDEEDIPPLESQPVLDLQLPLTQAPMTQFSDGPLTPTMEYEAAPLSIPDANLTLPPTDILALSFQPVTQLLQERERPASPTPMEEKKDQESIPPVTQEHVPTTPMETHEKEPEKEPVTQPISYPVETQPTPVQESASEEEKIPVAEPEAPKVFKVKLLPIFDETNTVEYFKFCGLKGGLQKKALRTMIGVGNSLVRSVVKLLQQRYVSSPPTPRNVCQCFWELVAANDPDFDYYLKTLEEPVGKRNRLNIQTDELVKQLTTLYPMLAEKKGWGKKLADEIIYVVDFGRFFPVHKAMLAMQETDEDRMTYDHLASAFASHELFKKAADFVEENVTEEPAPTPTEVPSKKRVREEKEDKQQQPAPKKKKQVVEEATTPKITRWLKQQMEADKPAKRTRSATKSNSR